MSENGEIYSAGKNFTLPPALTAWTNSTSVIMSKEHIYKCWRLCDRQGFDFILFWSKREIGGGFKTSTFITPNVHNTYVRS